MQQQQQQPESSSRLGLRKTGGEIVEVQGGHIVRSIGRKDRHSKVCTAKGARDRRVRLAAHTAIQFYDVQDRLGYDRPSKAVDWLIKNAKASIDELAELPAWNPTTGRISTNRLTAAISSAQQEQQEQQLRIHGRATMAAGSENASDYAIQHHRQQQEQIESAAPQSNTNNQSFLPPSMDSGDIADTIKSFFPMGASAEASSTAMHFQNYQQDLLSRTSSQNQDLRLSLQSFQDPMLIQSHQHHQGQTHQGEEHPFFSGTNSLGFDSPSAGWPEHRQPAEIGRFQRMIAWNAGADTGNGSGNGGGGGGFMFNSPPSPPQQQQQPFLQQLFGQSQFFSQGGPLQSSNTSSIRAWIDSPITDHHQHHHQTPSIHPSIVSGFGSFASGDYPGFRIPARIQGDEEQDNVISNQPPSSASSDSHH